MSRSVHLPCLLNLLNAGCVVSRMSSFLSVSWNGFQKSETGSLSPHILMPYIGVISKWVSSFP